MGTLDRHDRAVDLFGTDGPLGNGDRCKLIGHLCTQTIGHERACRKSAHVNSFGINSKIALQTSKECTDKGDIVDRGNVAGKTSEGTKAVIPLIYSSISLWIGNDKVFFIRFGAHAGIKLKSFRLSTVTM